MNEYKKTEKDRYKEQTNGYQWREEGWKTRQSQGLTDTNYYV